MAIYCFRVELDDFEASASVEVRSNQTAADLLAIALRSIGFDDKHQATWYESDTLWRKNRELGMTDEDLAEKRRIKLLDELPLARIINDPHQRFVVVYDWSRRWNLHLELRNIELTERNVEYSRITKKTGEAPKQYEERQVIAVAESAFAAELVEGVEAEDMAFLEGIEGPDTHPQGE